MSKKKAKACVFGPPASHSHQSVVLLLRLRQTLACTQQSTVQRSARLAGLDGNELGGRWLASEQSLPPDVGQEGHHGPRGKRHALALDATLFLNTLSFVFFALWVSLSSTRSQCASPVTMSSASSRLSRTLSSWRPMYVPLLQHACKTPSRPLVCRSASCL